MKSNYLKLASKLLKLASSEFSNNGCNDFYLDDNKENRDIVWQMYEEGFDEEAFDIEDHLHKGKLIVPDWLLMIFISKKLGEE